MKEPDGNSGKEGLGTREPEGENGLGSPSEKQPDEKDKNMDYASGDDNGVKHEAGDKPETGKDYGSGNEASSEASGVGSAYLPPREMNGTIFGRDDWMFCSYDNSIGYYCGSNIMSEQQMKDKLELMRSNP